MMWRKETVIAVTAALAVLSARAEAVLTFTVGGSWPDEARRTAAVNAMRAVVDRYNTYGDFGNHDIYVYYNGGIPTAQADYLGSIGFGGSYPNERVAMHETAHYLGTGTQSRWGSYMTGGTWDGAAALAMVREFDGEQAVLNGDAQHFWPYGLNYDSEGSAINKARQVAMVYALRADMGLGPSTGPSAATSVTLTETAAYGVSGFNYSTVWSDGHFPHPGAAYFTSDYMLRTPQSGYSFTFAGDSLTLDGSGENTGLMFKGEGAAGVTTFKNLILDGGWIDHRSTYNTADLFQLAGKVTVKSSSTIRAKQGNINILADVTGNGGLTIAATDNPDEDNRYVRLMSSNNTFTGDIDVVGRLELASSANQHFVIGGDGVNNVITGPNARRVLLNGVFDIDLAGASASPGDAWALVTAANVSYGRNFRVEGFTQRGATWNDERGYVFSQTTGTLTFVPEPAALALLLGVAGCGLARRTSRGKRSAAAG